MAAGRTACSGEPLSTREKGTLIGGAAAGYGVGNHMQNQQDEQYYRRGDY
jgi:hypothetical protein